MASPKLIRHDSVDHLERAPGVTVSGMVGEDSGATQISSGITTFAPGCSNTTHYHNAEESVIVIEGEGVMIIDGEEHHVKLHDAAFITPGAHHRIINTGEVPFKIAWSYATIHVSRTLVE
jgi:quercetin dioxygenase-like cupin family protein